MPDPRPDSRLAEGAPRILLAEDDPVTRMLLERQLKKGGYEVEAVADGNAALERFSERFYPLLVTDWEMPGLDGVELCRAVRAMNLDGYVFILLLTARDSKENIIAGLGAGADDYLTKPVHEAELIARLNTGRRILTLEQSLRSAIEQNRWLSITDSLTGAFNRRYLMEQLPRELERSQRYGRNLSVVICDIDHFKRVNDTHGHGIGDVVLKLFAERIHKLTRSAIDWIARYGGEEFIIILPETGLEGGLQTAEKIRRAIEAMPFETAAGQLGITASFGVAAVEAGDIGGRLDGEELVRRADDCLYQAKQAGRNRVAGVRVKARPLNSAGAA